MPGPAAAPRRLTARLAHLLVAAALLAAVSACGPRRLALPTDPGAPLVDPDGVYAEVTRHCRGVRVLTAEIGLSGRIEGRRVPRGRLQIGLAEPGRMRLLAVAPFGAPYFILAARPDRATLLLPRDDRYAVEPSVAPLVEAITGLRLDADDLRAILSGCVSPARRPSDGRQHANGWVSLTLDDGTVLYARQQGEEGPRIAAGQIDGIRIEYAETARPIPQTIHVVAEGADGPRAELSLNLSSVETNRDLPDEAFEVDVPVEAIPITVDELRRAGPLGSTE